MLLEKEIEAITWLAPHCIFPTSVDWNPNA